MQQLKEVETGGSGVNLCFVTHSGSARIELLAVGLQVADAVFKQLCAKSNKSGATIFFEGNYGKVEGYDSWHGEPSYSI